jgi:hypothetical protein
MDLVLGWKGESNFGNKRKFNKIIFELEYA